MQARINQPILCRCANHLFLEEYFLLFIEKPYRVGDLSPIFLKGHFCRQMHTHTYWLPFSFFLSCFGICYFCSLLALFLPTTVPFVSADLLCRYLLLFAMCQLFCCFCCFKVLTAVKRYWEMLLATKVLYCAQRLIMNYWVKRSVCTSEVKYFSLFSFICSVLKSTHLLFMRWCGLYASEGVSKWKEKNSVCGMQQIQWTDSHWKNSFALSS